MTPAQLSRELREAQSPSMTRRRWMVGLSLLGVAMGQIVTLFQTGIIKRLPDPPFDVFDSEKVDASDYAYKRGETPDAVAMMLTYVVTAGLAAAGGAERARTRPWLPLALAGKALADVGTNLVLAREEWQDNKALCAYCQAASVISMATAALAIVDAVEELRDL